MSVYKRGQSWLIKFDLAGRTYYGSHRGSKSEAKTKEAQMRTQAEVKAGLRRAPVPTFTQFVAEVYRPWAEANKRSFATADAVYLKPILAFFGSQRLDEITPFAVEKYKQQRRGETVRGTPRKASSINRELECLSKIFNLAVNEGHISKNPCKPVKKLRADPGRERVLSIEEERRLEIACKDSPPYLWPFIVLAIETGLRRGELLLLQSIQVDFIKNEIRLIQPKTGKPKTVPLSTRAREALQQLASSSSGKQFFDVADVKKAFATACRRAAITGLRIHDLRHTAATRWRRAGADPYAIRDLLGHATIKMSGTYTHTEEMERRQIVEKAAIVAESLQQEKREADEASQVTGLSLVK
jgi:integrase